MPKNGILGVFWGLWATKITFVTKITKITIFETQLTEKRFFSNKINKNHEHRTHSHQRVPNDSTPTNQRFYGDAGDASRVFSYKKQQYPKPMQIVRAGVGQG